MATAGQGTKEQTLEGLALEVKSHAISLLERIEVFRGRGIETPADNKILPTTPNAIDAIFESLHIACSALADSTKAFESLVSRIR